MSPLSSDPLTLSLFLKVIYCQTHSNSRPQLQTLLQQTHALLFFSFSCLLSSSDMVEHHGFSLFVFSGLSLHQSVCDQLSTPSSFICSDLSLEDYLLFHCVFVPVPGLMLCWCFCLFVLSFVCSDLYCTGWMLRKPDTSLWILKF